MPDQALHPCAYRVLRYTPNLIRDEWVNIGVLIYDPAARRAEVRLIEDTDEFARVRRLHPNADEGLLHALQADFKAQFDAHRDDIPGFISGLDETLSNALQLSPQKGVLTGDFSAELERLYRDHVSPPQYRRTPAEVAASPGGIRARISQVFRSVGIWSRTERRVPVEQFTYTGDPFKLDFAYRSNGTRGFVHALSLSRESGQAKVLAFTANAVRAKLPKTEFTAVTEAKPQPDNARHQFVARLFDAEGIHLLPVEETEDFAQRLRRTIH